MKFLAAVLFKGPLTVDATSTINANVTLANSANLIVSNGKLLVGTSTPSTFAVDVVGTSRLQGRLTVTEDIYFSNFSSTGIVINGPNVVYPLINIGSQNTVSGNTNIIVGTSNQGTGGAYVFGASNIANSNGAVTVGQGNQANTSGQFTVLIGGNNTTSHAVTTFTGMFAIGNANVLAHQGSSIMGSNQTTTGNNQLIFASTQTNVNSAGFNDIYFGTGPRSKNTNLLGSNITINGSGAGAGSNLSGGNVTIAGGKGTGTGTPGDVIISTASTTTSGSTLQSLTERVRVAATNGNVTVVSLAGSGNRMVIASSTGVLSTQAIPSATGLQTAVDTDKTSSGTLSVGTTAVKTVSASTYSGVFFDYVVKNTTNVRVGSVVAITNGTDIEFYETLSNDIGTTTEISFSVDLNGGNIRLLATTTGTGWSVIVSTRGI